MTGLLPRQKSKRIVQKLKLDSENPIVIDFDLQLEPRALR